MSDTPHETRTHADVSPLEAVQAAVSQPVQYVIVATSSFATTVAALLTSAFGLVAALAWNRALSDWLPTIPFIHLNDPLAKDFAYAGVATFVAVICVAMLGAVNRRLSRYKGRNLLQPPVAK